MRVFATLAGLLFPVLLAAPAHADYVGQYQAEISARDLRNSNGQMLQTVAAILRQDRANVHRYGIVDRFDEIDGIFDDAERRADLEVAVANSPVAPELARSIRAGDARVIVEFYGEGRSIRYVKIYRAD